MPEYYDREGNPISMMEWVRLFENREYAVVRQTRHKEKGKEIWLSTVWLGNDHSWGDGPPLIFETMAIEYKPRFNEVVTEQTVWLDWQERYTTEEEALEARDPWRVVTEDKPDIITLFLRALKK